ncbi:odorant receptor Or1-like isoform X2 [Diprion similis]|uniref:odorant receptor Or1-like isoform X2 n=1 Tax=Diprion similis TaxID=362088 RepID=UPI001EF77471|nr:odorant receptor Or1-like isoform X2 [Diprion similis]
MLKPNYFSAHLTILRIFGLWSYKDSGSQSSSPKSFLYSVYQAIFLFTFAYLFTVLEIIELRFSWKNFDDFISNLCYAIVHIMACLKISLILARESDIRKIISSFENGILQIRPGEKTHEEYQLVSQRVHRTRKLLVIYFFIGTSVVINGLLCPLYSSSDSMNHEPKEKNLTIMEPDRRVISRDYNERVSRKLPYMSYFPFDVGVTPYYELAYVYQGISLMTLSPIIVTTDVLYGSILLHIATQLSILARTLISVRSIGANRLRRNDAYQTRCEPWKFDNPEIFWRKQLDAEIYRLLKNCVEHHRAIISLTENMEDIFSTLVLLQFLSNLVIMCFPLFQITSVPIMSFPFFSMVSLMTAMMYQLFIFCNCGDELTQQSLLVADAACFCDWYEFSSAEMRRALLSIVQRSQKPLRLTVAKFAALSRETYLKVVQGSASYFMFLRKLHHANDDDEQ